MANQYSQIKQELLEERSNRFRERMAEEEDVIKEMIEKLIRVKEDELEEKYRRKTKELEEKYKKKSMELEERYQKRSLELEERHQKTSIELEDEKNTMSDVKDNETNIIELDIGGIKYKTSKQTLTTKPNSMLEIMFSGRHSVGKNEDGSIFIDRDGTHFRYILNFLRGTVKSKDNLPQDSLALNEIKSECDFYNLPELIAIIDGKIVNGLTVITVEEMNSCYEKMAYCTKQDIVMRNSILDNLHFAKNGRFGEDSVTFKHSADFSFSSLRNVSFNDCVFYDSCTYVFDGADMKGCSFKNCKGSINGLVSDKHFIHLIRKKKISFRNAKNIDTIKCSNENLVSFIKEINDL